MPDDNDALAVPIARQVVEETTNSRHDIAQALALRERRIYSVRAIGVDLTRRRAGHRTVVGLAKALVGIDRDTLTEANLGGLDGAAEVGAEDGVDAFSSSPLAELLRLLAAF